MRTIEIARKLAELNQKKDAQDAYVIALNEAQGKNPEEELEAASYIFFSEGDYQIAFTAFVSLYNRGCFQQELMDLMLQAFYLPNVEKQRKRYQKNCERLSRYRYLFRKDFLTFDELPIWFFPYSDDGYIPFYKEENRFGSYVNFNDPVIDRYFFKDLEKPILATDVYSQYQLEYLTDNVRKSEWVGRENHIYLHYSDWGVFCSYLQCLSFFTILRDSKQVFLIGEEIDQYPIDFKERFGIDYSKYPVRPIGIREVNRLIWHTQLSSHNGGDFFNEIFYGHSNLLADSSLIFEKVLDKISEVRESLKKVKMEKASPLLRELAAFGRPSDKDILVAFFLMDPAINTCIDPNSRIAPALFFQPHFYNIYYHLKKINDSNKTQLYSEEYEEIRCSPLFEQFKYIKTFTPMRRITTSYAATVRFGLEKMNENSGEKRVMGDAILNRVLNRSYLIDREDRLYRDSVLVRFEDGKLNPKATFTALAEFLDLPYTESMTYCSGRDGINPESLKGNVLGFDPATVYRTYDEYANNDERAFVEYFMRDAYETYGYDFHYYKGEPVDEEWVKEKVNGFTCLNAIIQKTWEDVVIEKSKEPQEGNVVPLTPEQIVEGHNENRVKVALMLLDGLRFVNKRGQPLYPMTPLKLDPALLEQPLYH